MANPQRENGHTGIAHEVMEQLMKADISGSEFRLILTVLRMTWGWSKKVDWISLTQFERLTGLSRWAVCKAKKALVNKRLLHTKENLIGFNKNHETWVVNKRRPQSTNAHRGSQQTHFRVGNSCRHTKERITKESITKESNASMNLSDRHPYLEIEKFKEAWESWLEIRKKIRAPNTNRALELNLAKLKAHPIDVAIKMLEQSTERGWRGVFPVKPDHNAKKPIQHRATEDTTNSKHPEWPKISEEGIQQVSALVKETLDKINAKSKQDK